MQIDVREPLRLDSTGQHLGGPLVGVHDNSSADRAWLSRCVGQLLRTL